MSLSDKLQKFNIFTPVKKLDQNSADMNAAFVSLHDLRKEIANISEGHAIPTLVHYTTILKYFVQLNFIEGRFPISREGAKVDFMWGDAFATEISVKLPSLLWEKVSILWNMAATQNNIGVVMDHSREEGCKAAAAHFCMAAGIFQHIQVVINGFKEERTRDISPQLLNIMMEVCLANAQSCVYEGAKIKGMKNPTLARLALGTSQAYQTAFGHARVTHATGMWVQQLDINMNSFHAAAHYHQSRVDHNTAIETRKGWGIECGRLAYANALITRAQQVNQSIGSQNKKRTIALEDLRGKIFSVKKEADNKNRGVYFDIEPDPNQLEAISPLMLAKAKSFDPVAEMEGKGILDFFANYVPQTVSIAMNEFNSKAQAIIDSVKEEALTASDTMRATLASLGLPASLQASSTDSGLPHEVWNEIASVQNSGGGAILESSLRTSQDNNREFIVLLDRCAADLSADASEDFQLRNKYGAKWQRATDSNAVSMLRADIDNYRGLLRDAAESDNRVRSKLVQQEANIMQLGCTRQQLDDAMPQLQDIHSVSQQERQKVESLVVNISSMLEKREEFAAQLDTTLENLDIKSRLLRDNSRKISSDGANQISDKQSLFDKTLEPVNELVAKIKESVTAQEEVLSQLIAANDIYVKKQECNPVLSNRAKILSGLQLGVSSFKEIKENIAQGHKFYEQFQSRVQELLGRVQDYCRVRKLEAREHISAIEKAMVKPASAVPSMMNHKTAPALPPPTYKSPAVYGRMKAPASAPLFGQAKAPTHGTAPTAYARVRAVALPPYGQTKAPSLSNSYNHSNTTTVIAAPVVPAPVQGKIVTARPVTAKPTPTSSGSWTCKICTFINPKKDALVCEMCNSVRQ